jgi:predicted RNA-binding protein with PIN domain
MARVYLIIDGYNLMHAAGLGRRRYGPGDLERGRLRLLTLLCHRLEISTASDTTVIFDAPDRADVDGRAGVADTVNMQHGGLTVRYSSGGRDADAEIERLLSTHSSPSQVLVVSSDHRLHKAAGGRRAKCVDSEKFLDLLETGTTEKVIGELVAVKKAGRGNRAVGKTEHKGTPGEMGDLLLEFLAIDVQAIQNSEKSRKTGKSEKFRRRAKK